MRDLPVKYAILAYQQQLQAHVQGEIRDNASFRGLVKAFSNCEPLEAFQRFKATLPKDLQGILRFAFPDRALSDIILYEHELVLASDPPGLAFAKVSLDTESFRLAGAVSREFTLRERDLLDSLSAWLTEATRPLFRDNPQQDATRRMFREMLMLHADKHAVANPEVLQQMASFSPYTPGPSSMTAFTHAMTADALYKADAAKALFGAQSGYYHAWLHQQMFRNLIAQAVSGYIHSFAA